MQRSTLENIIEGYDKDGFGINRAIQNDDAKRLQELVDRTSDDHFTDWVNNATECKSWQCLIYFLKRMHKNNKQVSKAWMGFSQTILVACRDNNQAFLDEIIRFFPFRDSNYYSKARYDNLSSYMFYERGFFVDRPRIDPENGYTALHWCVINKNPTLFQTHTIVNKSSYYLADNNHRTPLDLAIMLNDNSCINVLAKHMSFKKLAFNMTANTFKYIVQHDTQLADEYWDGDDSQGKIKNKLVELIDELDDTSKEKALNQALDEKASLGWLLLHTYVDRSSSSTDHDMRLLLAKKLLALTDKKEQESKQKKEAKLFSTASVNTHLFAQPDKTSSSANVSTPEPFLKPVYIQARQIPDYLNTKQFQAIFPVIPVPDSGAENTEKESNRIVATLQ